MHIAIEGFDGVGKTTICKMLAEKLDFKFIEKPLHYLFDSENEFENYNRIRDYVNDQENRIFTSWFYGLGNIFLYHKFRDENIITDRHLVSNYFWSGNEKNQPVYDCIVKLIGKPDYTFLLYARDEVILQRLKNRNTNDQDFKKVHLNTQALNKMKKFLIEYKMDYSIIDST
ncbi:unnamed protein product, partial [marine sediment metagenome]